MKYPRLRYLLGCRDKTTISSDRVRIYDSPFIILITRGLYGKSSDDEGDDEEEEDDDDGELNIVFPAFLSAQFSHLLARHRIYVHSGSSSSSSSSTNSSTRLSSARFRYRILM